MTPTGPKLLILTAPSGTGKTTLCQRLLKDFPNRITYSISSTSRAPRGQEIHGKDYFFLSREEFQKQIQHGRFAEWAEFSGNLYGTSKDFIEAAFARGLSLLLDIEVQGAEQLRKSYPQQNYSIFILPPSVEELERRLRGRGTDAEDKIQKRLATAKIELARSPEFHAQIVNDDLEQAYQQLKSLVERHVLHG